MEKKLKELKVRDIMNKAVFSANLDHTWKDVAIKMSAKDIHHLVIIDEHNLPVSVMSSADFLRFAFNKDTSILSKKLRDSKPHHRLITLLPDASAYDAANEMNIHLVESIVIVDEKGHLVGIVTPKDMMNLLLFEGNEENTVSI